MRFKNLLLEILLEGKIEDTLDRHSTIPEHIKQDYLRQVPANNAQHLDWVLQQHTKGNISPEHNINEILTNFNKVKDKLPKKQIHQYKSVDELHSAILPHIDSIQKSKKEKQEEGTETIYSSPTMTIRQHHNYESCVNAGVLPKNNKTDLDKATWCISVGDGGGATHHSSYTENGFHPVYSIEHHHSDGTSSKHMFVYDYNKTQENQELRDEHDRRPGFNDYGSTRPDLLDHYGSEHPEILKTPISKFFSEEGRNEYENEAMPLHKHIKKLISSIPKNGMSDEEYTHYFKEGNKKQQGEIHTVLAKCVLTPTQLTHLVEHGNEGSKYNVADRNDLSEEHIQKLANTSSMLVHNKLLDKPDLSKDVFSTIMKKSPAENARKILKHPKFNDSHIDAFLDKKMSDADISPLVERFGDKLEPPHIQKIIDKGDVVTHYSIIKQFRDKLEPHHISALIDRGNSDVHNNIINNLSDKLEPKHISALIDRGDSNSYVHNNIINTLSDKLEPHHISALIDRGNSEVHNKIINKLSDKLEPKHISALIDRGNSYVHNNILNNLSDKLEPKHIKGLMDSASSQVVNDAYDNLQEESKKEAISHVQKMKDSGNSKWAEFYSIHRDMPLSNVDKVKIDIHASLNGHAFPVKHNLSDEEIKTHIHPIIDSEIDNNKGIRRSGQNLVRFSSMLNKEQTKKLLNNIGVEDSINYTYGTVLSNHVRDAIFDHAINTGNHKLMSDTLVGGGNLHNIAPHHLEHIIKNHPENMPEIDVNGTHANELVATAIKDKNVNTISKFTNSHNPKYRSAILDHTLDTDNTTGILRHLSSRDNISHEDLDKILFHQNANEYKGTDSNRILQLISSMPNLHRRHIDHIIKSRNIDAIKNVIGSDYTTLKQHLTSKHIDNIISLKNKELSKLLERHRNINLVQSFNNSKVLSEWYIVNNTFERLLKESLISN